MGNNITQNIARSVDNIVDLIGKLTVDEKISEINEIKRALHKISPFANEPVDCVVWVKSDTVIANDYNPNSVAPPEMRLLEKSILSDGYTQPIVSWYDKSGGSLEVIDGFHRNRVGRECSEVNSRILGYLPIVVVNESSAERGSRIASTIRHNRARGKHKVASMSDIVQELARRNWGNEKIGTELGMEPDEVLRLKQISGLAEMFSDKEFSEAWELIDDGDDDSEEFVL